jgi:molybdopterin-guanine dinucleotide biosynthesis protein A
MEITGVILAGGKSSRMGTDKGLVLLKGKPLIQYVIEALFMVVSKVIIISNNEEYNKFGLEVYPDLIKEKGPVGGIFTALTNSSTITNIFVSCDTPFVTEELLNLLIKNSLGFDVTIPSFNNRVHPLIGVYKKSALTIFKQSLDNNQLKLSLVNEELISNIVNVDDKNMNELNFYNINTQIDLKTIENDSKY